MNDINTLFKDKVTMLRDLYIAMYNPQVKNEIAEMQKVESQYELLLEEIKKLIQQHPELKQHPMADRIPE